MFLKSKVSNHLDWVDFGTSMLREETMEGNAYHFVPYADLVVVVVAAAVVVVVVVVVVVAS